MNKNVKKIIKMEKKYNNINEEVDRIKKLFTEERLYGNLIIETPINSKFIDDLYKVIDDLYITLKNNKKSKNITKEDLNNIEIKIENFKNKIPELHKSFTTLEDGIKLLDPNNSDNITKKISDEYKKIFSGIFDTIEVKTSGGILINFKTLYENEINKISKIYNNINTSIYNKINEIIKNKSKFPDELTKEINELYPLFGDKLKKLYNPLMYKIMDYIKKNFPILFKKIKTILSYIIKWITGINNLKNQLKLGKFNAWQSIQIGVKWWVITSQIERKLCDIIYRPKNKNPIKEQYTTASSELQDHTAILIWKSIQNTFSFKLNCLDVKAAQEEANKYLQELSKQTEIPLDKIMNIYDVEKTKAETVLNKNQELINNTIKPYTDVIQPYYDKVSSKQKKQLQDDINKAASELD
jgi:hypothetical protein